LTFGDRLFLADALSGLAYVATEFKQFQCALRLFGRANSLREPLGVSLDEYQRDAHERRFAVAWAGVDSLDADEAMREGVELPIERLIADASIIVAASEGGAVPVGFTKREWDVLRLIAEGRSDREIADRLSISARTVGGHVTNLLGKLGVDSRTAAAAFAIREGLV
jgi:DNA-binding CsgD family transcriptional regulator